MAVFCRKHLFEVKGFKTNSVVVGWGCKVGTKFTGVYVYCVYVPMAFLGYRLNHALALSNCLGQCGTAVCFNADPGSASTSMGIRIQGVKICM